MIPRVGHSLLPVQHRLSMTKLSPTYNSPDLASIHSRHVHWLPYALGTVPDLKPPGNRESNSPVSGILPCLQYFPLEAGPGTAANTLRPPNPRHNQGRYCSPTALSASRAFAEAPTIRGHRAAAHSQKEAPEDCTSTEWGHTGYHHGTFQDRTLKPRRPACLLDEAPPHCEQLRTGDTLH